MSDYFRDLARDERLLAAHGFDHWPDDVELVRYAFDLEDALHTVCGAIDVRLTRDILGRWQILPSSGEADDDTR